MSNCSVCGGATDAPAISFGCRINETESRATGVELICSSACGRRYGLQSLAIAQLWPQEATTAEKQELREHENALLRRPMTPTLLGLLAGSIFKDREERSR